MKALSGWGRSILPVAALLVVVLLWGSSYVTIGAFSASNMPVPTLILIRFAIGGLCLLIAMCATRGGITRMELTSGIIFGAVLAVVIGLETWGVFGTTVSNAGVLVSVTILAVPFVERAFGSQRIPRASLLRAGLASGAILLLAGGAITGFTMGDVLIVLSALVRAVQLVLFSKVGNTEGTSSLHISTIQMLTVAAITGVFGGAYNLPSTLKTLEPDDWARLIYLGVGATAIAFGLQLWASRQIAPSSVALLLAGEPLVASLFATASGQTFEGVQYFGAAVLFATVIWGTVASFSTKRIGPKYEISAENSTKQPPD